MIVVKVKNIFLKCQTKIKHRKQQSTTIFILFYLASHKTRITTIKQNNCVI